jgi:putative selenate reductase molybdopterin-binding subunit
MTSAPLWIRDPCAILAEGAARGIVVDGGRIVETVPAGGNGTSTVHRQIAASVLGTLPSYTRLRQSDTDAVEHDTGAYGSTGTVVAGTATLRAAEALRTLMRERGAALSAWPLPT